ncbi:hypothetical protein VTO73DRAFT_12061 [Trametes versicolor]
MATIAVCGSRERVSNLNSAHIRVFALRTSHFALRTSHFALHTPAADPSSADLDPAARDFWLRLLTGKQQFDPLAAGLLVHIDLRAGSPPPFPASSTPLLPRACRRCIYISQRRPPPRAVALLRRGPRVAPCAAYGMRAHIPSENFDKDPSKHSRPELSPSTLRRTAG